MPNQSICKTFDCPFFSVGSKAITSDQEITVGYGCQRFSTAGQCLVSNVLGVENTQYELFYNPGGASPNKKTLIQLAINYLRDFQDAESNE